MPRWPAGLVRRATLSGPLRRGRDAQRPDFGEGRMTDRSEIAHIAAARGFVDNASALPTIPPVLPQQQCRTFDASSKADIFTRHRQADADERGIPKTCANSP